MVARPITSITSSMARSPFSSSSISGISNCPSFASQSTNSRLLGADLDAPDSRGWTSRLWPVSPVAVGFPALAGMAPSQTGGRPGGRGFPALAGMDRVGGRGGLVHRGIPRARGDGPEAPAGTLGVWVDSPRSRGWTGVGSGTGLRPDEPLRSRES